MKNSILNQLKSGYHSINLVTNNEDDINRLVRRFIKAGATVVVMPDDQADYEMIVYYTTEQALDVAKVVINDGNEGWNPYGPSIDNPQALAYYSEEDVLLLQLAGMIK
jgi:hypothetical protein